MGNSVFGAALNAVAPVVLLILLGYWLKCRGFLSKEFLKNGNWLVFHVCLSVMLFLNVYDITGFSVINWGIILYCTAVLLVIFVLGLVAAVLVTPVPTRRGVVWQSTFRSNFAILGLAMVSSLGGAEAESLAAVTASFVIPITNILGVIALSVFADAGHRKVHSMGKMLETIVKNPLILGTVLGMVCLVLREAQRSLFGQVLFSLKDNVQFLYTVLGNVKTITTPLALLILGGQFQFSAVRGLFREILTGTLWRTVLAPVLGIGGAWLLTRAGILHCGVNEYPTFLALFGAPAAVASAIMAGEMGGDEQLATQIVMWSSLFSVFTIFLLVAGMMSLGLLVVA